MSFVLISSSCKGDGFFDSIMEDLMVGMHISGKNGMRRNLMKLWGRKE